MSETSNITVRIENETKQQFYEFCENVGLNVSSAVGMFIKSVLRTRELPFAVTDIGEREIKRRTAMKQAKISLMAMQKQSVQNGTDKLTLEEINAEIAAVRGLKPKKAA